jgi:hypothetical protein
MSEFQSKYHPENLPGLKPLITSWLNKFFNLREGEEGERVEQLKEEALRLIGNCTSAMIGLPTVGHPSLKERLESDTVSDRQEITTNEWGAQGYGPYFGHTNALLAAASRQSEAETHPKLVISGDFTTERLSGEDGVPLPENESTLEYLKELAGENDTELRAMLDSAELLEGQSDTEKIPAILDAYYESDQDQLIIFCSAEVVGVTRARVKLYNLLHADQDFKLKPVKVFGIPRNIIAENLEVRLKNHLLAKWAKFVTQDLSFGKVLFR